MQATSAVVVLLLFVVALCAVGNAEEDKYPSKYDNIDVDQILSTDRLFNAYTSCFMSQTDSGCTAEAKAIKGKITEALTNNCAKCTNKQKENLDKICKYLIQKRRDIWDKVEAKFDQGKIYRSQHPELFA